MHPNGHSIGTIRRDEVYTVKEFQARMQMGIAALRTARRRGLPVRRIGRRSYVLGSEALDYIATQGKVAAAETRLDQLNI